MSGSARILPTSLSSLCSSCATNSVSRFSDSAKSRMQSSGSLPARLGEIGQGRALELAVLLLRRLDDEQLVPFAVEQQPAAPLVELLAHRRAPVGVAVDLLELGRIVRGHRRLPGLHALEQVRALEAEIHAERAARGLRHQLVRPRDRAALTSFERGEGRASGWCWNGTGRRSAPGAWLRRDLLEIGDRGHAALGQHVEAACRLRPSRGPARAAPCRRRGATASACRPRRCAPPPSRRRSRPRRPPSTRARGWPSSRSRRRSRCARSPARPSRRCGSPNGRR